MFQAWCPCLPHLTFGFTRPSRNSKSESTAEETSAEPISNGPSSSYGTVGIPETSHCCAELNGKIAKDYDSNNRSRCMSSSSDCVDSGSEKGFYHSPVKKRPSNESFSSKTSGRRCSELTSIGEILPDLYQRTGSILTQTGSRRGSAAGKIRFRLFYNFNKSDFVVTLVEVSTLSSSDSELFVTVFIRPELDNKQRQTKTAKASQISEIFKFPCVIDDLQGRSLHFEVWTQSLVRKSLAGAVDFELSDVDVSTEVEIVADLEKDKQDPQLGRLLVSLAYLPAAERLTVTIVEAKDLKINSSNRHSDVYVKVNVCHSGKRVKKRRTGTKRNSGNPEWNEQLSFDVQHDLLKQLSVEILVVDRDANEVIGRLIISQTGNRDTKQHWEEMVEGKSGHHPVWYKLSSNQTP